jgi:hypothetical protein
MGTNYHVTIKTPTGDVTIHLGKRSCGSRFLWNFNSDKYYKTYDELTMLVKLNMVHDEYGTEMTGYNFLKMALTFGCKKELVTHEGESHVRFGLLVSNFTEFC